MRFLIHYVFEQAAYYIHSYTSFIAEQYYSITITFTLATGTFHKYTKPTKCTSEAVLSAMWCRRIHPFHDHRYFGLTTFLTAFAFGSYLILTKLKIIWARGAARIGWGRLDTRHGVPTSCDIFSQQQWDQPVVLTNQRQKWLLRTSFWQGCTVVKESKVWYRWGKVYNYWFWTFSFSCLTSTHKSSMVTSYWLKSDLHCIILHIQSYTYYL